MIGEGSIQSRGLLIHQGFPVKVYAFVNGFSRLYGTMQYVLYEVSKLMSFPHVKHRVSSRRDYLYTLAFAWGFFEDGNPVKVIDLFSFDYDKSFRECNPEWIPSVFKNGHYDPEVCSCGTCLMVLGVEELTKRLLVARGGDLEEYLELWPDLGSLGPIDRTTARFEIKC